MNERAIFLAVLAIVGGIIISAFPMLTVYVLLFVAWRAHLLLNPDKPKQEAAALMRSATLVVTLFIVGFLSLLTFLISRTPPPLNLSMIPPGYSGVSTYYFPGNPFSALVYDLMGRDDTYHTNRGPSYITFSPVQPVFAAEPEATADPLD